jgi:FkbM family methyltransferase
MRADRRRPLAAVSARLKGVAWRGLAARGVRLYREPAAGADLRNPTALEAGVQRVLLRELLGRLGIDCVLDVGAHVGEYGALLRDLGYRGEIVSFEPAAESFAQLAHRAAGDPRWQAHRLALGERRETLALHRTRRANFSSFLRPAAGALEAFPDGPVVEVDEAVPVVRLDEELARVAGHLPAPRILLKVDTQGFDLRVVRGAGRCLERVLALQLELSVRRLYEEQPGYREALGELERMGFELVHLAPVTRDADLRALELDGLFLRNSAARLSRP